MDPSVDPCEDFYSFACGGFITRNVVPDDDISKSVMQEIQEEVYTIVKKLIENPVNTDEDRPSIVKAKKLYHSCLSENWTTEDDGRTLVSNLLESVGLDDWPALTATWDESKLELEKVLAVLSIYQVQPLIDTFVSTDDKNSSIYTLQFYRGGPALERDFYLNETHPIYIKYLDRYYWFMVESLKQMGASEESAKDDVTQIVHFEKQLANLTHNKWHKQSDDNDTTDDENYSKLTVAELQQQIPEFDWVYMLEYIFSNLDFDLDVPTLTIIVYSKNYLEGVMQLVNDTPKRVLSNYLLWRFMFKYMPYLNQRFSRMHAEFRREVPDPNDSTRTYFSRWKECVAITNDGFGMVLGSLYVTKHFSLSLKNQIHDFIGQLKHAFVEIIPQQTWLDEETKKLCKDKIWQMGEKVGYPKYILDPDSLEEEYEGLEIEEQPLLGNILRVKRFEVTKELKKLKQPVDKEKNWYGSPLDVNAFYRPNFNEIVFPAGILRAPFYNDKIPSYLKFGSIGVVIAHEITHGFDNYGRKYDKNGNHTTWWPEDSIEKFTKEANCFVEQYSNYKMDLIDEHVNGNETLGDNICDNAGLKHAYVAYHRHKREHQSEPKLPGIDYTEEQLFFIQYGQIWCEVLSREGYIKFTKDPHSPGRFRTNGALSNSPEFATTFNCPLKSPMNPHKKCRLWV